MSLIRIDRPEIQKMGRIERLNLIPFSVKHVSSW